MYSRAGGDSVWAPGQSITAEHRRRAGHAYSKQIRTRTLMGVGPYRVWVPTNLVIHQMATEFATRNARHNGTKGLWRHSRERDLSSVQGAARCNNPQTPAAECVGGRRGAMWGVGQLRPGIIAQCVMHRAESGVVRIILPQVLRYRVGEPPRRKKTQKNRTHARQPKGPGAGPLVQTRTGQARAPQGGAAGGAARARP